MTKNGKGDIRRKPQVPEDVVRRNWCAVFGHVIVKGVCTRCGAKKGKKR